MAKKEVAKKGSTEVAAFDESVLLADAGLGLENVTKDDIMIPRLSILQALSPQVNKRDGAYIEGAEQGSIYNNVADSVVDGATGITVVPISFRKAHLEWKADRGGFVADHGPSSACLTACERGSRGEYITSEGNEIVPTSEFFVFVINAEGEYSPASISMSKSQSKKARQWNAMMQGLTIPVQDRRVPAAAFWTAYQLTTVPQENDQGAWFGWSIKMLHDANSGGIIQQHPAGKEIYLAARAFMQQVKDGEVQVKQEESEVNSEDF
jgi:hypothetical protein